MATACTNAPTTVCRTIAEAPLQARQPDARPAHVRRSSLAVRRLCADLYVIVPATRFPKPRRAYARRSWCVCVCASQKSQFRRQTLASRSARAGGVSLPWFAKRGLERRFDSGSTPTATRVAVDHVHATALVSTTSVVFRAIPVAPRNCACNNARRADASRSWCVCVCASQKSQIRRRTNAARTRAGGVSPRGYTDAIATASANAATTVFRQLPKRHCKCVSATHGGLTSAARDACAFVHRKSRNYAGGRTRANKSGGA